MVVLGGGAVSYERGTPVQDATSCETARDAIGGQEILNRATHSHTLTHSHTHTLTHSHTHTLTHSHTLSHTLTHSHLQDAAACDAARDALDGQEILNRAVKVILPFYYSRA